MSAESPNGERELFEQPQRLLLPTDQDGLILRQIIDESDDAEFWQFQQNNHRHIARYGNTIDETVETTTRRRVESNRTWFSIRKDDIFIGMIGFVPCINSSKVGEPATTAHEAIVGIEIAETETGKGYASSALAAATTAMLQGTFTKIIAEVDPANEPSLRMCRKVGFIALPGIIRCSWGSVVILELKASASDL